MFLTRTKNYIVRSTYQIHHAKFFSTDPLESEYTATPVYPPILDLSYDAVQERKKLKEYEEVKAVKSIEEKQIKLNMPRYYGFRNFLIPEENPNYGSLPFIQHITRTHLIKNDKLPKTYDSLNVSNYIADMKSEIEDIFTSVESYCKYNEVRTDDMRTDQYEDLITSIIVRKIHNAVMNILSDKFKHLSDAEVTDEPRIESHWVVGGMDPPEIVKKRIRSIPFLKHKENDPIDRMMCYTGKPILTMRSKLPLSPLLTPNESENKDLTVPFFKHDPYTIGTWSDHRHIANVPGFWPGDENEFGTLSYHKRGHISKRVFDDPNDKPEALDCLGISSSFGWLNAQANFQGFTTFNDITYPLISQAVVTNGRLWSFYVYQLNSMLLYSKNIFENPKSNVCWATPEMKLFEEIQQNRLIGLNENVIEMLLKFYCNTPQERLGVNFKPYVDQEMRVIADYKDDEKAEWLEREYKFLTSNRPRHYLPYEIYNWEKIYKIDHKTRHMEPRRRPFELGENPYARRLDDRKPRYIPRALRPDLPKNKGRDAKEFFP